MAKMKSRKQLAQLTIKEVYSMACGVIQCD